MLTSRSFLPAIVLALFCSVADAQLRFRQVARFDDPNDPTRRFRGGREVEFAADGERLISAFYGCTVQLFDLKGNASIGTPIRTSGDGEVGFVNKEVAFTADWDSVRLWDAKSGRQIGEPIPHELREDTIINPAIDSQGNLIATRVTMKSVQLRNVATRRLIGAQLNYPAIIQSIRFSNDDRLLFVRAGGSLYAIDVDTGKEVVGPLKSEWQFKHFPGQQKLVTAEQVGDGLYQLVSRSTDQKGWPETHRSDLSGKLKRLVALSDNHVLAQVAKQDYTPGLFTFDLAKPETRVEVKSNADRAFAVVVAQDKRHWICSNIRNISCYRFDESEPVWQKRIAPSGYDQQLYPLDDRHFIIRDKQENFGVYKIADGSQVWTHAGVKRFSLAKDRIALCTSTGVEVWAVE
ncbi:MAG: WD40 repeat domain-containing protein [Phycisphaera sp. RhM]|nr:WD40 repeat domain-containing protein [Phycisphaera sp. RhM]